MERIAFFDTKPYDRIYFDKLNRDFELVYFESQLRPESVKLAEGCRAVCALSRILSMNSRWRTLTRI